LKTYWKFYWPLALTGLAMVLSMQFQTAALARYPQAITELAVFALAFSTYGLFNASMNFTAQLSNVYARSVEGSRRCHKFVFAASICVMLPLLVIAHTDAGSAAISNLYSIDDNLTARVTEYLVYLAPLILLRAERFYLTGLLVQARLTGWVTVSNAVYLVAVVCGLLIGFSSGFKPVYVLVGADAVAITIQVGFTLWIRRRYYRLPKPLEHENLSYRELASFFIPVSTTGVMFALSRPVLFAFVSRTPEGIVAIAAMRVAFDFSSIFQQAANQFRHFFVTFGLDDLERKRRFMIFVCAGLTGMMLLFAMTPLSNWVWQDLMQIPDEIRVLSVQLVLVMCLMPSVILFRNYFHGRLMVERRTTGMAVGGVLRVAAIYLMAQGLFAIGLLNYLTASIVLILGFVVESLVVMRVAVQKGQT